MTDPRKDDMSPEQWLDSAETARLLRKHRNSDVRVRVFGTLVPVSNVQIIELPDRGHMFVIELAAGPAHRAALDGQDF